MAERDDDAGAGQVEMTPEQFLAAFDETKVFELVVSATTNKWNAFYRCKFHYRNPSRAGGCDYDNVFGDTPKEAVANALAKMAAERLK